MAPMYVIRLALALVVLNASSNLADDGVPPTMPTSTATPGERAAIEVETGDTAELGPNVGSFKVEPESKSGSSSVVRRRLSGEYPDTLICAGVG